MIELSEHLANLLVLTSNVRLLVLKENGSKSVIVEDISQHKFEVIIDKYVKCSCNEGRQKHCIHIVVLDISKLDICSYEDI